MSKSGEIGRRAGLRIQFRKECGFKSLLLHQLRLFKTRAVPKKKPIQVGLTNSEPCLCGFFSLKALKPVKKPEQGHQKGDGYDTRSL